MARHSCCTKQKLRKGLWSPEEDEKLYNYITRFGVGCWSSVPKLAGLQRCGKSCRLRWINYLRPDLKRGMFSQEEEDLILHLHKILGNRWAQIASQLPGRTDNEIKNFWNSCLKKKLMKQGIDPQTHQPIITPSHFGSTNNNEAQAFKTPTITPNIFQAIAGDNNNINSSQYGSRLNRFWQDPEDDKIQQPFSVSYQSLVRDINTINPNYYSQQTSSLSVSSSSEMPSLANPESNNAECFSQSSSSNNNSNSNSNNAAGFTYGWENPEDQGKFELAYYGMIKMEGSCSWEEEQLKSISLSEDLTTATDDGSFDVFLQHM